MNPKTVLRAMYKAQIAEYDDTIRRADNLFYSKGYFDGARDIATAKDVDAKLYQKHNRQWWKFYRWIGRWMDEKDAL